MWQLLVGALLFAAARYHKEKRPRWTFFSFQFKADIWRVNVVRKSWVTRGEKDACGFHDMSLYGESSLDDEARIRRRIDRALEDSEVTVVLFGETTCDSKWVQYEIAESIARDNALIAVGISQIRDQRGETSFEGNNPFEKWVFEDDDTECLADYVPCYDWCEDDGHVNLRDWIHNAPRVTDIAHDLGLSPSLKMIDFDDDDSSELSESSSDDGDYEDDSQEDDC